MVSTGVLIVGAWLAADKASFINITLNITTSKYSPASNFVSKDAEKILKVLKLLFLFKMLKLCPGVCWACSDRAGCLYCSCSWSFHLHHFLPRLLRGCQGEQGASHCLWDLHHYRLCSSGLHLLDWYYHRLVKTLDCTDCSLRYLQLKSSASLKGVPEEHSIQVLHNRREQRRGLPQLGPCHGPHELLWCGGVWRLQNSQAVCPEGQCRRLRKTGIIIIIMETLIMTLLTRFLSPAVSLQVILFSWPQQTQAVSPAHHWTTPTVRQGATTGSPPWSTRTQTSW